MRGMKAVDSSPRSSLNFNPQKKMSTTSMLDFTAEEQQRQEEQEYEEGDEVCESGLMSAALSYKLQVVEATWNNNGNISLDTSVYSGLMGTAFACLRSFLATSSHPDLLLASRIVHACAPLASSTRHVTFLCGRGGIYALGVVIFFFLGDRHSSAHFLHMFHQVAQEKALPVGPEEGGFGMSYDLLCGRAGFLYSALFINSYLGESAVANDLLMPVVEAILAGGRAGACVTQSCPLMFRWHGTRYWGAPHGLAGILHVLLHFPLSEEDVEDVKSTLRYMMSNRFPNSGNYPSSEGNPRDTLVQWSHGATSMAITLCKASQLFPNERDFREGAIEAGEVVWKRGLVKKLGLADGVAGNAYAFLSLYRLTGDDIYLQRAKAFATYLYHKGQEVVSSDNGYSLFEGVAGIACLFWDVAHPHCAKFPGYEL